MGQRRLILDALRARLTSGTDIFWGSNRGDLVRQEDVDAFVNTVNCLGIMGKGIALQFRNKWPAVRSDTENRPESRVHGSSPRDAALKAESRHARMSGSSCRASKAI